MKIFRRTVMFWTPLVLISLLLLLLGYRTYSHGLARHIADIYAGAVRDIVVLGLIIPITALLLLWKIADSMSGSRMLAFQSRENWWKAINRILIKDCIGMTGVLLLPVSIMANVCISFMHTWGEITYVFFVFLTWFLYFYFVAVCMVLIMVTVRRSIVAFCFALLISYLPNAMASLLRQLELPTIGGIFSLSYAFNGNEFRWVLCQNLCAFLLCLLVLMWHIGKALMQKRDIFWRI